MQRYHYTPPDRFTDYYCVRDAKRGFEHATYEHVTARAVALCRTADDAQLVTDALNRAVRDDARQGPTK